MEEKKWMTVCVRSGRGREAMTWSFRSSRNLQKAGIRSVTMSAVPIPISTLIFPRMYCIWQIWDSSRFLLSRLSHSRPMNMHCRKRIFRFSLKNMINWQQRWFAVTEKEILSTSSILWLIWKVDHVCTSVCPDVVPEQSILRLRRGEICIRVISSSETKNSWWEMSGMVWKIHSFGTSLNAAMSMQKKSAVSALQDFTVVGDVLQIHTISMGRSQMPMIWDASFRRNVSNAQSW